MNLKRGVWVVLSTIVNLAVVLLMLSAVLSPRSLMNFFSPRGQDYTTEKLTYVQAVPKLPTPPQQVKAEPVATNRVSVASEAPVVAPPAASDVPPPTTIPTRIDTGASGPASAGIATNTLPGSKPNYADDRIWGLPTPRSLDIPLTGRAKLDHDVDSAMNIMRKQDSIAASRNPTDWTVGEGKTRVGLDPQWIYLGPVKVPTMLLGLIKLPVQGNPNSAEKQRTLGAMAQEARTVGITRETRGNEYKSILARAERARAMRKAEAAAKAAGGSVGPRIPPP